MADQGIELRSALGGEDCGDRHGIGSRSGKPIDRFRRHEDQLARPQSLGGGGYFAVAVNWTETFTLAGI